MKRFFSIAIAAVMLACAAMPVSAENPPQRPLTVRLVVHVVERDTSKTPYDFEAGITKKLRASGLNVVSESARAYDATLFAECRQVGGSNYSGEWGTRETSNALGVSLRLETRSGNTIFRSESWNTSPWPYNWNNSDDAGVQNLEEGELYFRYLGDLVTTKLRIADDMPILLQALKAPAWTVRMEAAGVLAGRKDPRSLQPLIHTLGDERQDVAESAANALGHLSDRRAIKPLCDVFSSNFQADARRMMALAAGYALENIGGPEAEQCFRAVLADSTKRAIHDLARSGLERMRGGTLPNR